MFVIPGEVQPWLPLLVPFFDVEMIAFSIPFSVL
jgi:hypothetical protein